MVEVGTLMSGIIHIMRLIWDLFWMWLNACIRRLND